MRRIFFAMILAVACATSAAADTYEDAVSTYDRGDFALAARLFRPLAEQGNEWAQYHLAGMYRDGQGVPQDYQEALKWYRLAAEQGNAWAQYHLAGMYRDEQGVPQDFVRAHMWLKIAAAALSGDDEKEAIKQRDDVASRMTAAQIEKAREMAWRCQESKFKECD